MNPQYTTCSVCLSIIPNPYKLSTHHETATHLFFTQPSYKFKIIRILSAIVWNIYVCNKENQSYIVCLYNTILLLCKHKTPYAGRSDLGQLQIFCCIYSLTNFILLVLDVSDFSFIK